MQTMSRHEGAANERRSVRTLVVGAALALVLVAPWIITGCSDSSPHTDAAIVDGPSHRDGRVDSARDASTDGRAKDGPAPKVDGPTPKVDGPAPKVDGPTPKVDGPAPKNDGPAPKPDGPAPKADVGPVLPTWTVAATRPEFLLNTTLATHPTQPKTIAVKLEVFAFAPLLQVVTSSNLGSTISTATLQSFSGTQVSEQGKGFGYDPANGQQLALLSQLYGIPGPPADSLVFATSTNGGKGFLMPTLTTNPFPPDGMKFVGGTTSALFVRAQHVLSSSTNLGTSFTTVFQDSSKCLAHGDFAVSTANHATFLLACNTNVLRCENAVCANAQRPAGVTAIHRIELSAANPQRALVAADNGQVLLSKDGGKTFSPTLQLSGFTLVSRLLFDPRAAVDAMYVFRASGSEVYRSTDAGASWQNLKPAGAYLRDLGVAADGTLIGLGNPGVITYPAP